MRKVLALVALLLAAPAAAAAQESLQPLPAAPHAPVTEMAATSPVQVEVTGERVKAEARKTEDAAASRDQFPQRGSFWWLVGVIVVAGVILAVVLN